jgi:hypothetical protein
MLSRNIIAGLALFGVLGLASTASAQDDWSGAYDLGGHEGFWGFFDSDNNVSTTLWLAKKDDGTYDAVRRSSYRNDEGDRAHFLVRGTGTLSGRRMSIAYVADTGISERLSNLGGTIERETYSGQYTRRRNGKLRGWSEAPNRDGSKSRFYESGTKGDDRPNPMEDGSSTDPQPTDPEPTEPEPTEPDPTLPVEPTEPEPTEPTVPDLTGDVHIDNPAEGYTYLVGQAVQVQVTPADAALSVEGPATHRDGTLTLTGPGQVTLTASQGDDSHQITITAVTCEVTEITVLDALTIQDARPPHFRRDLGQEAAAAWEPAAILQNTNLRLQVTLKGAADLSEPATITLTGRSGSTTLTGQVQVQSLSGGEQVEVSSSQALNDGVDINALELSWKVGDREAGADTDLRVYTVFANTVDNPLPRYSSTPPGRKLATKLHFELVCDWANGAGSNSSTGSDSICYTLDNAFRHHVAWEDYGSNPPVIPHYAQGTASPVNYGDLGGSVRNGKRSVSSIYYPPLEPNEDYEQYRHYSNNFGWWVLDNPQYTGGRCNQQASLICDVFGTAGISARVYYIERYGSGARTGRPMRRYYKSSRSSRSWNFHGVVEATLADGTTWIYDGSGSSPPRRINGATTELFRVPNGTFVDFWHEWQYQGWPGGTVPEDDRPTNYVGQDGELNRGEWRGVPMQPGE